MDVYRNETYPLIEYYGDQIIPIDAEGEVEEINDRALSAIRK